MAPEDFRQVSQASLSSPGRRCLRSPASPGRPARPALDRAKYADLFQLNSMELDLLTQLTPRRQILLKRPELAKVLNLNVDPKSYWLYTNTPIDNERVAAVIQEFGFEAGLDRLAASA